MTVQPLNIQWLFTPQPALEGNKRFHKSTGNFGGCPCPGKKVEFAGKKLRLFRDLTQDVEFLKSNQVSCIVCCLNRAELAYLRVRWSEYSSVMKQFGIEVIEFRKPPIILSYFRRWRSS